ncbi:MAG: molybdopterin-dependent oxidoreductase, partial [Sandarakinorhabdus sp.]|nr:molybdopterin-dependent oxidoreductase [Sandarakinorhabdus sp.]
HWRMNSTLAGLESADVILIAGADPRLDAPLLNSRIRKAVRRNGATVFRIGGGTDPSYPLTDLGDDMGLLSNLAGAALERLTAARRPALLLGSRNASAGALAAAHALAPYLVKEGWNGFNILHDSASRVGAMTVGWNGEGMGALAASPPAVLFLLGVDEIDLSPFSGSLKIYIGSHGDAGAAVADIILPGAAWAEKPGTYMNLEGRVQRSLRAVFPPGDAREDWTIFRALADVLGVTLPYDCIAQLRSRIAREWPELRDEGLTPARWETARLEAAPPTGPARQRNADFYSSNPILRASPTMRACVAEILEGRVPQMQEAAE